MNDAATIATIRKNGKGEAIVVRLTEWSGHQLCDVRQHYTDAEGELRPTVKGCSFNLRHLGDVIAGLQAAFDEARRRGLIGGDA
jgi:hypothetical protein